MLSFVEPVEQMAAVLHDAIEDTELELDDLVDAGYTAEVVEAVECLTHREGCTYEDYIETLAANPVARRVKIADLRENLANNRRSAGLPGNAQRIARYKAALARLTTE
ncbi:MAG: GTP pyrophosphokinase [Acidimicrobiales bacterium]